MSIIEFHLPKPPVRPTANAKDLAKFLPDRIDDFRADGDVQVETQGDADDPEARMPIALRNYHKGETRMQVRIFDESRAPLTGVAKGDARVLQTVRLGHRTAMGAIGDGLQLFTCGVTEWLMVEIRVDDPSFKVMKALADPRANENVRRAFEALDLDRLASLYPD